MEADLFIENETPRAGRSPQGTGRQWVKFECGFCGLKGGQYLEHYDKLRCDCGHRFWALQVKRGGGLALFQYPEQKEAA